MKRFLALVISLLILCLSLASCGEKQEVTEPSSTEPTITTTAPSTEAPTNPGKDSLTDVTVTPTEESPLFSTAYEGNGFFAMDGKVYYCNAFGLTVIDEKTKQETKISDKCVSAAISDGKTLLYGERREDKTVKANQAFGNYDESEEPHEVKAYVYDMILYDLVTGEKEKIFTTNMNSFRLFYYDDTQIYYNDSPEKFKGYWNNFDSYGDVYIYRYDRKTGERTRLMQDIFSGFVFTDQTPYFVNCRYDSNVKTEIYNAITHKTIALDSNYGYIWTYKGTMYLYKDTDNTDETTKRTLYAVDLKTGESKEIYSFTQEEDDQYYTNVSFSRHVLVSVDKDIETGEKTITYGADSVTLYDMLTGKQAELSYYIYGDITEADGVLCAYDMTDDSKPVYWNDNMEPVYSDAFEQEEVEYPEDEEDSVDYMSDYGYLASHYEDLENGEGTVIYKYVPTK